MPEMTAVEYLWGYCQLRLHGYDYDEAKEKLEEIENKMLIHSPEQWREQNDQ